MTAKIFHDNRIYPLLPSIEEQSFDGLDLTNDSDSFPTTDTSMALTEHFRNNKGKGKGGGGKKFNKNGQFNKKLSKFNKKEGFRGGGGGGRRGGGRGGGGRGGGRWGGGGGRWGGGKGRWSGGANRWGGGGRWGNRYYYNYPSATGYYDHYDINNSPWGLNFYDVPLDYLYNPWISDYSTTSIVDPVFPPRSINFPLIESQSNESTNESQSVSTQIANNNMQWVYLLLGAAFIVILLLMFRR